jgi:hypothetical protein
MNQIAATLPLMVFACFVWKQPASAQNDTANKSVTLTIESGARQSYDEIGGTTKAGGGNPATFSVASPVQ